MGEARTRITIIDPEGTVVADSENDPASMENHAGRPEVQDALKGRRGVSTRFSSTMNQEVLYVALPIEKDGRFAGVVRTSLFVKDIKLPGNLLRNIGLMWGVFSLLALVVAVIVSRSVSRPIRELTLAARKLASGDFGARVFLKGNDEFRALADTFNSTSREAQIGLRRAWAAESGAEEHHRLPPRGARGHQQERRDHLLQREPEGHPRE